MSLIRSLKRGYMKEALNMVLDGSVVEGTNRWIKGERYNIVESDLSMLAKYTQV